LKERILILAGLVLLMVLMVGSFVGLPWNPAPETISNDSVAEALFRDLAFSIIVMALLLAVAMVGGVFLARKEEEP
jgi:NADH:ubiquinone oxidoreductase subunit 6 (subunit J)